MPAGRYTDPELKTKIINKIRDGGMSSSEASKNYGVPAKTIYGWLKRGVVDGQANLVLEINRLRKENEQLYNLLGRATAELKHPKR
jgi:transposase